MKPRRIFSAARLSLPLASALVALLAASTANSQTTLYWDGATPTGVPGGGTGTWDTSTVNWDTSLTGNDVAWDNTNTVQNPADTAVFGGTAGTVTLGTGITVGGLTFSTTGYTVSTGANTLTFGGTNNSILFNNIAAATITGAVGGSGNLIFSAANPATAGALALNGTSTGGWSGTTTINPGMTLNLSNDNQALNNTSGITLNGGGITLTNSSATAATNNKISDSAAITSNGGTISIINTSGAGVYAETIGSVALTTGQLNIGLNNNHTSTGSQTLTLSGLTRTGATNTSAVTFSAFSTGPNTTKNMIAVTGYADGFMGAWATTGTGVGGASQTDYAFITDVGGIKYVTAANIGATAQDTWTSGANVTLSGASALTGTRTLNTLRYTGNQQALALGANNLETYGILNGGTGLLTISSASTGVLTTPTGGGHLHLNAGNSNITVSAPINDNGGAVTLVKNGASILTLSSTTSNFSGGVVLNAGRLNFTSNANLGSGGGITVNGNSIIDGGDQYTLARTLTLNEGARLELVNGFGVTGVFSGNGTLFANSADDHNFTNAANTFTGAISVTNGGTTGYGLTFASIGDTAGAGLISLSGTGAFRWTSASSSTTTLANRQFAISAPGGISNNMTTISALGTTAASNLVINRDLLITGAAGARALRFAGTNLGDNTFAGNITDGTDGGVSVVTIVKEQAGKWILSGNNTYSGGTIIGLGTLVVGNASALGTGIVNLTGGTLESTVGTLTSNRFVSGGNGTITASLGGSLGFNKFGTGTLNLNGTANDFTGGITVGGGTLAVGASSTLGQNVSGNSILIRDAGILALTSAAQSGNNQTITLSSSSKSGGPVSATGGGAGPVGRLAVLSLGFNGLPNGSISQANTNGGVIAIRGVTGYNTDLSTLLTGNNLFLGATGSNSTFTGAAGTVVAGNGNLYRLGGGGSGNGNSITFNTTNLFTGSGVGVQVGSTAVNGGGTVVIQAAQDYTGATTVSQGTLTLSGANGTATGSSGFTLNGGKLTLDNATNNSNRIGNTAAVNLSNGGELQFVGNASGTSEVIGDLNLGAGYSIVTSQGVTATSTLVASAFNRTNNGTALFRGNALGLQTVPAGRVTLSNTSGLTFVGASTLVDAANTDTTKDVKIIPYLIGHSAVAGAGETFVTYDDTLGFRALNTTNHFNTTVTANTNVRLATAQTGISTNSINSLIIANNSSSTIADGNTLTVASGAILFTNTGTIAPVGSGTGILAFGAQEGVITTVATGVISARITGSAGLTKSGMGQLTLSNANNSFSGGIVVNAGTLVAAADANLGDAANTLTFNGNSTFNGGGTFARSVILNNGAVVTLSGGSTTISNNVTGTGGLAQSGNFGVQNFFTGTANTFEGPILIGSGGVTGQAYRMQFASLADSSDANGRIVFLASGVTHAEGSVFEYTGGTGGNTSLALNNRQIELASQTVTPTNGHQIRNNSVGSGTLSIATDLLVSTPIAQTLSLRGTNTGANTFSGKIIDGDGKVSLLKTDAGRWIVSGANTFSGTTLVSGGTLELGNSLALQNSALDATNSITGGAAVGLRTTVTSLTLGGLSGNKNLNTLFTTTSGGYNGLSALTLNPGAGVTLTYSGDLGNGNGSMSLTKTGAGTQILTGTNTYTGTTTVTAGSLVITGAVASTSVVVNGSISGNAVMANATLSGSGSIDPGNSPGILTVAAIDPTGGLDYNFEFTAANTSPAWSNAAASVNDVLRLTSATTPFTASMDATNQITLYLGVNSITVGDVFTGGFFTDRSSDFLSSINSAAFSYLLADDNGLISYNGNTYTEYTGPLEFNLATVAVPTANFSGGTVTDGYVTQFTVIPEPNAAALLGTLGAMLLLRRRR